VVGLVVVGLVGDVVAVVGEVAVVGDVAGEAVPPVPPVAPALAEVKGLLAKLTCGPPGAFVAAGAGVV
jgi:hypothetical protein